MNFALLKVPREGENFELKCQIVCILMCISNDTFLSFYKIIAVCHCDLQNGLTELLVA